MPTMIRRRARVPMAADGADPATLLCADREDILDCAVILQPETALSDAMLVIYVGMLGMGDALGSVVPAGIDVTYRWPNLIEANLGVVARLGLSAPPVSAAVPPWLTLRATVAVSSTDPGFETTLAEEGAIDVTAGHLLESYSRHLLTWMSRWQDDGFEPVRAMWLRHSDKQGQAIEISRR